MVRAFATREELKKARGLVKNPTGKTPFGRPKRTWELNIKMSLEGTRWEGAA
jgi:hypothetical protein